MELHAFEQVDAVAILAPPLTSFFVPGAAELNEHGGQRIAGIFDVLIVLSTRSRHAEALGEVTRRSNRGAGERRFSQQRDHDEKKPVCESGGETSV